MKYFRYVKIYLVLIKASVQLFMAHRFNFFMGVVANILWTVSQLISLQYLFTKIPNFQGWSMADLVLLLGFGQIFVYCSYAIFDLNLDKLLEKIIKGQFDRLLTKPVNIMFMASFEEISVATILPITTTVTPLIIYGLLGQTTLTLLGITQAFLVIILGVITLYFLSLAMSGLTFYFEDVQALKEFFILRTNDFARIPLSFFPQVIQYALTFVIPIAFVAYYPVLVVKEQVSIVFVLLLEIVLLLMFSQVARLVWRNGLKHYSGIG